MKLSNPIGWCDDTTNAVTGCDKITPGCAHCYAEAGTRARVLRAQGIETWGPKGVRHPVAEMAAKLRRLNKLCLCDHCHQTAPYETHLGKRCPNCPPSTINSNPLSTFRRIRLFADSNSDWLDKKWPIETLANFLKVIYTAPNVDILLLTKRPENFEERMTAALHFEKLVPEWRIALIDWIRWPFKPWKNIWLGTSVENQKYADLRIPQLLKIPAALHFLSIEPLLSHLTLDPAHLIQIDWIIVGGESGPDRRDCGVAAITDIADQCQEARVPVYVKQDCAFKSGEQGRIPDAIWNLKQFPPQRAAGILPADHSSKNSPA